MKIYLKDKTKLVSKDTKTLIKRSLKEMGVIYKLEKNEVSVTLVDEVEIRKINNNFRNIDKVTDVISFALNEGEEPEIFGGAEEVLLGEIVVCVEQAKRQAKEYGHSTEREIAYLSVHGMLHLLGYDHMTDEDKKVMRQEEEHVMEKLNLKRSVLSNEKMLLEKALLARKNAYAPYSGFKVGAALLTGKGDVFTGTNVENSSFGLSICAERLAIFNAINDGQKDIAEILVVGESTEPLMPCGACRQVMLEFGVEKIHAANTKGKVKTYSLDKILPDAFSKNNLK